MGVLRRLGGAWWEEFQRSRKTVVLGPKVTERRGLDEHHPIRPPEKWKRITILGGTVYINGHDPVKALRECPVCAALIVDDAWAKETHMGVCRPALPGIEEEPAVELGESA